MLRGRRGHARAIILTIVEEEFDAVVKEFEKTEEVRGTGCWTIGVVDGVHPVLITQSSDRTNVPSAQTVRDLVEDWQPEIIVVCGIAGGIAREEGEGEEPSGPLPGDVVCAEYVHYGEYTKNVSGRRLRRYFPIQHPSVELIQRHVKPIARTTWYQGITSPANSKRHSRDPSLQFGELVSVEFLAGDATAGLQRETFELYDHALAVDMESAGVARAMDTASSNVHYRPAWICIRGISDRSAATVEAQIVLNQDNDLERKRWRGFAAATAARVARIAVERVLETARPPHEADPGAPAWSRQDGPVSVAHETMS